MVSWLAVWWLRVQPDFLTDWLASKERFWVRNFIKTNQASRRQQWELQKLRQSYERSIRYTLWLTAVLGTVSFWGVTALALACR